MSKKETRQEAVMRLLGEGKDIKQVAKELGIKVQLARSYKWRAENPEKYAAMLERYFAKRKAKKAAEAKKAAKPKKPKKTKKAEKPVEAEETVEAAPAEEPEAEEPTSGNPEEKDITKQKGPKPINPWAK